MEPQQVQVKAVIFDVDGLLLDTESIYTRSNQSIAAKHGKIYTEELRSKVVGASEIIGATHIVEGLQLPFTPEEYLQSRNDILNVEFPKTLPMPGALRIVEYFRGLKIPVAIATSSNSHHFKIKSDHIPWFATHFDARICGDNPKIKAGKPNPDIFLVAAEALGVPAKNCLVFEDSPSGVTAGKSAGMRVIAVPSLDASLYPHADYTLSSLNDFDPTTFNLPKTF